MVSKISQSVKTNITSPHVYVESNEHNKLINRIETEDQYIKHTDSVQRGKQGTE